VNSRLHCHINPLQKTSLYQHLSHGMQLRCWYLYGLSLFKKDFLPIFYQREATLVRKCSNYLTLHVCLRHVLFLFLSQPTDLRASLLSRWQSS